MFCGRVLPLNNSSSQKTTKRRNDMCNFRYVLFDLDGTISDTSEGIYNCVYYVADKLGFERPRE